MLVRHGFLERVKQLTKKQEGWTLGGRGRGKRQRGAGGGMEAGGGILSSLFGYA